MVLDKRASSSRSTTSTSSAVRFCLATDSYYVGFRFGRRSLPKHSSTSETLNNEVRRGAMACPRRVSFGVIAVAAKGTLMVSSCYMMSSPPSRSMLITSKARGKPKTHCRDSMQKEWKLIGHSFKLWCYGVSLSGTSTSSTIMELGGSPPLLFTFSSRDSHSTHVQQHNGSHVQRCKPSKGCIRGHGGTLCDK